MNTKTLFSYIPIGTTFKAANGDVLIKRRENRRPDLVTACYECQETVGANAILEGLKIDDASRLEFVHICPMTYIWIA